MSRILPYDELYRIVVVGDSGVGKSSLITRFSDDEFKEGYASTVGVDFRIRTIQMDSKVVKLQLWDTSG